MVPGDTDIHLFNIAETYKEIRKTVKRVAHNAVDCVKQRVERINNNINAGNGLADVHWGEDIVVDVIKQSGSRLLLSKIRVKYLVSSRRILIACFVCAGGNGHG